jgi:hypothetical protein
MADKGKEKDKRKVNANEDDQRNNRTEEHPDRGEPDTLEGPGGRNEAKAEQDALNKSTRRENDDEDLPAAGFPVDHSGGRPRGAAVPCRAR